MKTYILFLATLLATTLLHAAEYHVSIAGLDENKGSSSKPFKTISRASQIARPGDVITVHEGVYRERVNPQRGGTSEDKRIVYRAAPGEKVVIKGSELVKGWSKVENDTWTVTLPNGFFEDFNPFNDLISGDWFNNHGRKIHTGAVYLNEHWLTETFALADVMKPVGENPLWFAQVDAKETTLWGQFKGADPNEQQVEVNVRQTVFYPDQPGINYITVSGFIMQHAATPWAPPTAEQIGLIGTHWSKGWIIEDNEVSYSACVGITLGKHGDEFDNTSANSAEGYVKTIERGLARGWSKKNIGSHTVRRNHIHDCEQAGIVGSMGAAFCTIDGNTIHDIYVRKLFSGAEMGGIKFHGAIDTVISNNHIYRCSQHGAIWLDWMTQGTCIAGNLLHDNSAYDIFVEVNHGPFLVYNNICLSHRFLLDRSEGGAYVHNLIAGSINLQPEPQRETPYHPAHSTEMADLVNTQGGDNRFYNNMFLNPKALDVYDQAQSPSIMSGNRGVEAAAIIEKTDGVYLEISTGSSGWKKEEYAMVTTDLLGQTKVSGLPYENPDGSPFYIDSDYAGNKREEKHVTPGPFAEVKEEKQLIKIWPRKLPGDSSQIQ